MDVSQTQVQSRPVDLYELLGVFFPGMIVLFAMVLSIAAWLPEPITKSLGEAFMGLNTGTSALVGLVTMLFGYLAGHATVSVAILLMDEVVQRRMVGRAYLWLLHPEVAKVRFRLPEFDLTRYAFASFVIALSLQIFLNFTNNTTLSKWPLKIAAVALALFLLRSIYIWALLTIERTLFRRELANIPWRETFSDQFHQSCEVAFLSRQACDKLRRKQSLTLAVFALLTGRPRGVLAEMKALQQLVLKSSSGLPETSDLDLPIIRRIWLSIAMIFLAPADLLAVFGWLPRFGERILFAPLQIFKPLPQYALRRFYENLDVLTAESWPSKTKPVKRNADQLMLTLEAMDESVRHFVIQCLAHLDPEQCARGKRNYYMYRINRNCTGALLISTMLCAISEAKITHEASTPLFYALNGFSAVFFVSFALLLIRTMFLNYRVYHKELFLSLAATPQESIRKYSRGVHASSTATEH